MNWQLDVTPAPALLVLPAAAASLDEAHAAIELWEHYSGKTLDPTQRLVVEVMMAQTADGRWAASTTGREMPRQNGKGDELEVVELWGLVQRDEAILHTIHDAVLLASQTQERMLGVIEGHADLRRKMKRRWKGTGQQMIEMRNGGIIWYRTRTGGGGRGVDDIDRLVIDEAQHASDEQLAAMTPTLLANPDPQMNVVGTAGLEGKSSWWWQVRKRALSSDPGAFGYVGHTAERVSMDAAGKVTQETVDATDRDLWWASNPALHAGRGRGVDFLEEQFRNLGPAMFAQEHLCVWCPDESSESSRPIPPDVWDGLKQLSTVDSNFAWSVVISDDRKWSTIGAAGRRTDGRYHVEVVDNRPDTADGFEGRTGLFDRCRQMFDKWQVPVRIHKDGAEGALIAELRERGIEVDEVSTAEYARATGQLIDAVQERDVHHLGQRSLDVAVERADVKQSSSGAVTWIGRQGADVSPLKAVTVALGGVPQVTEESQDAFVVYG